MLDIRLIRERPDYVRQGLINTGVDGAEVDRVLDADARRRKLQHELDEMRARRTRESRELGKATPEEREKKRAEMRELADRISAGEKDLTGLEAECERLLLWLPNLPRDWVPVGPDDSHNIIVRSEGTPRNSPPSSPSPIGKSASSSGSSISSAV